MLQASGTMTASRSLRFTLMQIPWLTAARAARRRLRQPGPRPHLESSPVAVVLAGAAARAAGARGGRRFGLRPSRRYRTQLLPLYGFRKGVGSSI